MPSRSFDPDNATVLSVLEKYLSVPLYQRPYTWKPENVIMLWDDLWAQESGNFLGIIVLHDNGRTDEEGSRRVEIIDGQQRITTLTVIFALIRNLAESLGDDDLAAETHMALERSNAAGSQGFILLGSNSLRTFMHTYIQPKSSHHDELISVSLNQLSSEEERIVRNYRKTHELILGHEDWNDSIDGKIEFLRKIKLKLLQSELIQVTVNSEDDAYDLFETLNARSVSLSEVNMIKNRIFMSLTAEVADETLEARWSSIEVNSGGEKRKPEDVQKFINYFWWSRYAKVPPRKIFRSLRNENLEFVFEQLEEDSAVYNKLRSRNSSQLIQYRHIDLTSICVLASLLNLQQVYIPLLSLARKFNLPEDRYWSDFNNRNVEAFIAKLEKFIFAYKFSPRSPAAVEKMYSDGAIAIFRSKNRTEFVNALLDFEQRLNDNFPTEDEFKQQVKGLTYKPGASANNRLISYVLGKVYFGDNKEVVVGVADIEHIFPRNPQEGFKASEIDVEDRVNSLGNLTLLAEEINRIKCGNKRPLEKSVHYRESNITINHQIADEIDSLQGWGAEGIDKRRNEMIDALWEYIRP